MHAGALVDAGVKTDLPDLSAHAAVAVARAHAEREDGLGVALEEIVRACVFTG